MCESALIKCTWLKSCKGDGNFKNLSLGEKISCLSLMLLHCMMKYRIEGKILHNPQVNIKKCRCSGNSKAY